MKSLSSKQMIRIEKKKKKMAALLEITKLNEHDRNSKCSRLAPYEPELDNTLNEIEPNPKRFRVEHYSENKDFDANGSTNKEVKTIKNDEANDVSTELGPSGKQKLSGEEFVKLKKLLKENTERIRNLPKFRLREQGEFASLSLDTENRVPLFVSDVQHLIMYSQIGPFSPYNPARWCQLEKFPKLVNTNVLIIENVSLDDFSSNESQFSFLNSTFKVKLEVLNAYAYKGDIIKDITMVPLTSTQMKKYITEFGTLQTAVTQSNDVFDIVKNIFPVEKEISNNDKDLPVTDKFPRTHLLLSGWQMVEENFPLPIKGLMDHKYAGYVLTKDYYKDVTPSSPMFGIDCEMCKTSIGDLELTRVSIVNEKLEEFYEQLVKPNNKIIDYLTRYSGITPKLMKNVTKRLQDVQEDIRRILPPDAILVGQSLGNDLHALKMMHPYVIDSSVIYNITGDRSRKTKLQTLAREFLNERIQEGRSGHCSIEDSVATLKLVQLKLAQSLHFGDAIMSSVEMQARQHPELGHPNYATSMLKQCTKMDKTAQVVSTEDVITKYRYYTYKNSADRDEKKIKCVIKESNKAAVQQFCDNIMQYSLNIAHLKLTGCELDIDKSKAFQNVDAWVKQIYEHAGMPSLNIIIFGGQRDSGNGCCFIKLKSI